METTPRLPRQSSPLSHCNFCFVSSLVIEPNPNTFINHEPLQVVGHAVQPCLVTFSASFRQRSISWSESGFMIVCGITFLSSGTGLGLM
jgi:hypothetical protein